MAQAYYNAPNHSDLMLAQLGINIKEGSSTFDPANQPKQIGRQFQHSKVHKQNRYLQQNQQDDNKEEVDQDFQIPAKLKQFSHISTKVKQDVRAQPKKGRKKQSKKIIPKNKVKPPAEVNKQTNNQLDIQLDEVAEWGEKGTKVNNQQQNSVLDSDQDETKVEVSNTAQQEAIRKRIQQKLKKYQNPGSAQRKSKSNSNSLQSKALELKKLNEQLQKKQIIPSVEQSSQDLLRVKPSNINKQQTVMKEQQEQSEDPWENINKKTLAQKQTQAKAIKNAQYIDFNKYYESLDLPDFDDQDEEPSTGIFQTLCGCLSSKPKPIPQVQKQIIKISTVQLTNKPQQIALLKSIWIGLTNKKYLRYGQHWSQIGFQGRDPATDLRSTGILSLIHWDNFIKYDHNYATKLYNFCTQFDIPLALTHIKITSLLCSCLKKRQLEGKTWQDFLQWYYAFVYYTFSNILEKGKSLDQIGELVEKSLERTKQEIQNAKKYFYKQIKSKR